MTTGAAPLGGLAPMDRAARLERVMAAMGRAGCQALVVTKPVNVRWLCGFTGSSATAVVAQDRLTVITDGRYRSQIDEQLAAAEVEATVVITRELQEPVVEAVGSAERVGLEANDVTWARQRAFAEWLAPRRLVATDDLIETERRIKDSGEIARLRAAATIADRALDVIRPELGRSRTERAVAQLLDRTMLELGAEATSFATIVAAGPNSAKPHAIPTDRVIGPGDMVVVDFGAKVDGYGSDMTRSFIIGPPSERQLSIFCAVELAQAAGVEAVQDGVEEREIDAVCRGVLSEHGLADAFVHGTGHGIGLEIHENPILSSRATGILRSGSVVTVEPGAYLPDYGGIRIEDSVVVTDTGCEPLTTSSKSPTVPTD